MSDYGAGLVEYVVLLALMLLVCLIAAQLLADPTSTPFSDLGDHLGN